MLRSESGAPVISSPHHLYRSGNAHILQSAGLPLPELGVVG